MKLKRGEGQCTHLNLRGKCKCVFQVELQLNQNNGRITIDGDMELFTTQGRKYLPYGEVDVLEKV